MKSRYIAGFFAGKVSRECQQMPPKKGRATLGAGRDKSAATLREADHSVAEYNFSSQFLLPRDEKLGRYTPEFFAGKVRRGCQQVHIMVIDNDKLDENETKSKLKTKKFIEDMEKPNKMMIRILTCMKKGGIVCPSNLIKLRDPY